CGRSRSPMRDNSAGSLRSQAVTTDLTIGELRRAPMMQSIATSTTRLSAALNLSSSAFHFRPWYRGLSLARVSQARLIDIPRALYRITSRHNGRSTNGSLAVLERAPLPLFG